jgi:hypothetical protein
VTKIAIGVITLKLRVKETVAEIWRHPVTEIATSLMAYAYSYREQCQNLQFTITFTFTLPHNMFRLFQSTITT